MERLDVKELDANPIFQTEHRHRYIWASRYATGAVCDVACGNGYGGQILSSNAEVSSYIGIDASDDAVSQASLSFSDENRKYVLGSATAIALQASSIDTVVSLETLEHLEEPEIAVREFLRILKPEGILVGSVPSKYFDDKAEEVYGKNIYHVTRFTSKTLLELLQRYFGTVRLYYSSLEVVSHIGSLKNGQPCELESAVICRQPKQTNIDGSIHFIATNRNSPDIDSLHENQVMHCMSLIDLDARTTIPLRKLIESNEEMVRSRDAYIKELEATIRKREREMTPIPKILRWVKKRW
jgi:ubiquinone/menaquinone biosynthesis C-methylase UbiE